MRSRAVLATALALTCAWLGCRPRPAPSAPATASHAAATRAGTERECASCHAREAEEWRASLHRASFTDADFQASFAIEPVDFCFRCHAPLARDRADTAGASLGIGCASCHALAPGHAEGRSTRASTASCAGCHEFSFPHQRELMQSTVREHASSPFAARSCADCHMPRAADGHKDHRFDVSRNEALLRASIDVASRRTSTGIEVDLTTRDVGHAMPTGDLFRRMLVVVRAEDASGQPLGEEEVVLGRRFERLGGVTREREDTRVVGRRTVALEGEWLTGAERVSVEVRYERVAQTADFPLAGGGYERRDKVFAAVTLARSTLERRPSP